MQTMNQWYNTHHPICFIANLMIRRDLTTSNYSYRFPAML
jgi:hypothetical protein